MNRTIHPPRELDFVAAQLALPSPSEAIRKAVAARLALGLEELLGLAITRRLGTAEWSMAEIAERTSCATLSDGRKVWALDGEPILETLPIDVEHTANTMTATRSYRFLTRTLPSAEAPGRIS